MTSRISALLLFILALAIFIAQLPSIKQLVKTSQPPQTITAEISKQVKKTPPQLPTKQKISEKPLIQEINSTDIPDFSAIKDVKQKKFQFFSFMLKNIKVANTKVLHERKTLQQLSESLKSNNNFSSAENIRFKKFVKKYRVASTKTSTAEKLVMLKQKIDAVPPSLILAQSANESAWGTSRFAKKGNNYFGQWCYSKGCGLVPASRDAGASHEVAKFATVQKSVEAYIYNINVGRSYKKIRQLRAQMQHNKQPIDSLQLATGLEKYSERGSEYVKEIQSMIRFNKLQQYD